MTFSRRLSIFGADLRNSTLYCLQLVAVDLINLQYYAASELILVTGPGVGHPLDRVLNNWDPHGNIKKGLELGLWRRRASVGFDAILIVIMSTYLNGICLQYVNHKPTQTRLCLTGVKSFSRRLLCFTTDPASGKLEIAWSDLVMLEK